MNLSTRSIVLFDPAQREHLLPLAFTRPVAEFRFGILTQKEKWQKSLSGNYSYLTAPYLQEKYPLNQAPEHFFIAANICPNTALCQLIENLKLGEVLRQEGRIIAFRGNVEAFIGQHFSFIQETTTSLLCFDWLYDLFMRNEQALYEDYRLITEGRHSQPLPDSVRVLGNRVDDTGMPLIFIEEGATLDCTILNVKKGPIYIGKDVEIQEGSALRGPLAVCEHAVINLNTKIYGATTLGPYVKVGGELNNVIFFGYANKAHDGFLGNAVIGEWCNLGAGVNASNLKNDYSEIKLWNYGAGRFLKTGLQFCGLIMGDHSKVGINGMLNTATVLGVGVNVYGAGFPRNFVPSFSEGGTAGFNDVSMNKFLRTATLVMSRRGCELTDTDKAIFDYISTQAETYK